MPSDPPAESSTGAGVPGPRPRKTRKSLRGWDALLAEPRNLVWVVLGAVLLLGGGRRLVHAWRARGAVARLQGNDATLDDVAAVVPFGRAGLPDLFRLLTSGVSDSLRHAAGQALSVLWARDELIAEEEKGLVVRGFRLDVRARKRYPRGIRAEIPVTLDYGVPFLEEGTGGVAPASLEWSHRVVGARRASLEKDGPWTPGPVRATFTLVPDDFETDGPHALIVHVRARTVGLTDGWELVLPQVRFGFEFDPILRVEAILALPDESREAEFRQALSLEPAGTPEGSPPRFLPLPGGLALREPPVLGVSLPLPNDLAHDLAVEFEGVEGRFPCGSVVVSGQGARRAGGSGRVTRPLGELDSLPPGAIDRPGRRRMRAVLTADPHRAWADPDVRSLWPGTIETDWIDVEVVRT